MSSFLPDGGQKSGSSSSEPIMPNQASSSSNAPGSVSQHQGGRLFPQSVSQCSF